MKAGNIAAYLGLMAVAGLSLWAAAWLSRRYQLKALRWYLISLASSFAVAFLRIIGNYTSQEFLWRQAAPHTAHAIVAWVFHLLSKPFAILSLYAFLAMILAWAGRRLIRPAALAFLAVQGIQFAALFVTGNRGLLQEAEGAQWIAARAYGVVDGLNLVLVLSLLVFLAVVWLRGRSDPPAPGVRTFAILSAVFIALNAALSRIITTGLAERIVEPLLLFLTPVPPLVYLWVYFRRRVSPLTSGEPGSVRVAALLNEHHITGREAEIIGLLIQGKSYREIERQLFISLKTVKTHAYNIYRKLGVKSRWQLLNLLR